MQDFACHSGGVFLTLKGIFIKAKVGKDEILQLPVNIWWTTRVLFIRIIIAENLKAKGVS